MSYSIKSVSLFAMSLLVSTAVFGADVAQSLPTWRQAPDQAFCFFKATAKNTAYMMKYHPGANEVQMYMCGTQDAGKAPRRLATAKDLRNLIVIRNQVFLADLNLQLDKKFVGYRESALARELEAFMAWVGVLSDKPYAGTLLVDEYAAGLPMKWVFNSNKELSSLLSYFTRNIQAKNITVASKPVLMLQFVQAGHKLSAKNREILEQYFTLAEYNAEAMSFGHYQDFCEFMVQAQKQLSDALSRYGKETPTVGQTFGEIFYGSLEKEVKDFKTRELLGAIFGAYLVKLYSENFKKTAEKSLKDGFNEYAEFAGLLAGAGVGYLAFRTILRSVEDCYPPKKDFTPEFE